MRRPNRLMAAPLFGSTIRMPLARLTITLPDGTWAGDVSSAYSETTFRVIAAMPGDGVGYHLVQITGDDLTGALRAMDDHPTLTAVELVQADDRRAIVQFESETPILLDAAGEAGLPIQLPIDIRKGAVTVEFTATRQRLSELADRFDRHDISFDVDYVSEQLNRESVLSEKQQSLLQEAVERGYYDTPRECTLTDLAQELEMSKSTVSERLHRIEGAIIKQFVAELPRGPRSDE